MAEKILMNEFKTLLKEKWVHVELYENSLTTWSIGLMVLNPSSLYHGGYFRAVMHFPSNYPYSPPSFRFTRPLFHPNIYPAGQLCISILHEPGDDEQSGEQASERWSPVQRVESVLLSIISLLDDAECSSPANVDAAVLLRADKAAFGRRVKQDVINSLQDVPDGFVMPTQETAIGAAALEAERDRDRLKECMLIDDDDSFWVESDEDDYEEEADDDDDDNGGVEDSSDTDQDDEDREMTPAPEMKTTYTAESASTTISPITTNPVLNTHDR